MYIIVFKRISGERDAVEIRRYLIDRICKIWDVGLSDIKVAPNESFSFKANLKEFFDRAITNLTISTIPEKDDLVIKAEGEISMGKLPWVFLGIGFFTGIGFALFAASYIEYALSKNKPKRYLEEIFNSVELLNVGSGSEPKLY